MKRIVFTLLIFTGFVTYGTLKSQTPVIGPTSDPNSPPPQALTYQAQAIDSKGEPIKEKDVSVYVAIHALKEDSYPPDWENRYYPVTDKYGMFTIILGDPEGNDTYFNKIPWYKGPVFLEVVFGYKGEETRSVMQFLTVPYAMHAGTAQNALSANEVDWDNVNNIPLGFADNMDNYIDDDSDPTNELQDWSTLPGIPEEIADGDDVNDADADPTNELQDLSGLALKSNVLQLDNSVEFTPDADYEPATKKYVDDNAGAKELNDLSDAKVANGSVYIGPLTGVFDDGSTSRKNTALGSLAGSENYSGSGNVFIGFMAGMHEEGSNKLYIHNGAGKPLIYGDFETKELTINSALGIGDLVIGDNTSYIYGTKVITLLIGSDPHTFYNYEYPHGWNMNNTMVVGMQCLISNYWVGLEMLWHEGHGDFDLAARRIQLGGNSISIFSEGIASRYVRVFLVKTSLFNSSEAQLPL